MDSSPAAIRCRTHWCDGLNRRVGPPMETLPVSCCPRSTACASAQLSATGISTWTCLPARIAAMDCSACSWVGVHRMTASTSSLASTSSRSVPACPTPYLRATSSACSSRRLTTDVTVTPSMFARPSRCLMPKAPVPARAIFMSSDSLITWLLDLLAACLGGRFHRAQHQVPDGGVGTGDVVEAVQLLRLRAERAAHDQPHDQFDALGAGLADKLQVFRLRELGRVLDQPVHERVVPRLVDEARARALQLVAHPAGAPDVHVEVLVELLRHPADRLAEHEAAVGGGRRVLHHVHGQRDHRDR